MISEAKNIIKESNYLVAFTGAGISVESGIPPFRGENGIWNKYDPEIFDLEYFYNNPKQSWEMIKNVFLKKINQTKPNKAHYWLAELEKKGVLKSIITQNIDNLHHKAGSSDVIEFHGNSRNLVCLNCKSVVTVEQTNLEKIPPKCKKCNSVLKPDFIFFGEQIPTDAFRQSIDAVEKADVLLVIGTTGMVIPASQLPYEAHKNGAKIIEINIEKSAYTNTITDIFLRGKASEVLPKLSDI